MLLNLLELVYNLVKKKKIIIKNQEQIEKIKYASDILSRTFGIISKEIKPGVKLAYLDKIAEEFIRDNQAVPAFKNYRQADDQPPFPGTLCLSLNDEIVHGTPRDIELKEGDILSVDCGVNYQNYFSDSAYTFSVGEIAPSISLLLDATKKALYKGVQQAKHNQRVGDISFAVEKVAKNYNLGIVKDMVGHGVGVQLHEPPEIPNYGKKGKGVKLKENMIVAIEPMFTLGTSQYFIDEDGWTVRTKDNSYAAHFEHTVLITKKGGIPLTTFDYIEQQN